MRVILDECLPEVFASDLSDHQVVTVREAGFSGFRNGELLKRIDAAGFQAFITIDKNLPNEQRLVTLSFGVIVLRAKSNRLTHLRPLKRKILAALKALKPGQVAVIARAGAR
ncbi:MAG: hypothetical protein AB7Q23_09665 [Hyphomonadaceae bacterium]